MKKRIILTVAAVALSSAALIVGCHGHTYESEWSTDAKQHWHAATCCEGEKKDVANHAWQSDGGETPVYTCTQCGYVHQHTYHANEWVYNSVEHWRAVSCGHAEAPLQKEEHDLVDGVCVVCSFNTQTAKECEVAFSYVVVDDAGQPVVDENGSYQEVGVTYTSVKKGNGVGVDTVNGATLYAGDTISFTVEKSVFCYYTDSAEEPLVEIIKGDSADETVKETLEPDENGVYTVTVTADTVISVANVLTRPSTITGDGSITDPYIINSVTDWLYFSHFINNKEYYSSFHHNTAYWELNCDLDFEGESIYVVGDGFTTENSVFCGNFNGNGHTISNFTLDNAVADTTGQYSRYLGLFGVVSSYEGVNSLISNLTVENFTVNAVAGNDDIVSVGGIIGYGVGANVRNCTVRNANINVIADDSYMSYAGGVVGFLQSVMSEQGIVFYASVGYSASENVIINGSGMLYDAGGIAGRAVSYNDQVTTFIFNSYSSGSISGAVRSGGIVGELQRNSSVQNSYSTAEVSAHSTFTDAVINRYAGTALDDRYSYAGGIVGYAENDTLVSGCFFDGATFASAAAGSSYAKSGSIVADCSAAGYADLAAERALLLNNAEDSALITADYLQNQLKWSEVDWVFSESSYPTVNQTEGSHRFNVAISVGGEVKKNVTIDSVYLPMSYWYVIDATGGSMEGIPANVRDTANPNKLTFGYYFDEALTKRVPTGFVPTYEITLYAAYADTSDIVGSYYFSNGGTQAKLTIYANGSYEYEEGPVLATGVYDYDGNEIKLRNSYFSRISQTATATQKATYYTFWATKTEEGDLLLYDCEEQYVVSEDDEAQNSAFADMARFYARNNPLKGIAEGNIALEGGYYYADGGVKHVFTFAFDGTGSYRYFSGEGESSSAFDYVILSNGQIQITVRENGRIFVGNVEGGLLLSIDDARGVNHPVAQLDAFVGTWEKQATSHKIYTFDGMGAWTYEHYTYLAQDGVDSVVKKVVTKDSGSYEIIGGILTFTRTDGVEVTASVSADGSLEVAENGSEVKVAFTGLHSFKGVWYSAGNKVVRYTLTMNGLNQAGVGTAVLEGFESGDMTLRYQAVSENVVYLYAGDLVYAILSYDVDENVIYGSFYDTLTQTTSVTQTFYLYDDFKGEWVCDVEGMEKITFNGLGGYDVTDSTGNTLAVNGVVKLGNEQTKYALNRADGGATFTFKGVKYTLVYNEYQNAISVAYEGGSGAIVKADEYANIVFLADGTSYSFDGRGNFAQGGTALVGGTEATYVINADGSIAISGAVTETITPVTEGNTVIGYQLSDGTNLTIENAFTGTWAVYGKQTSISVGALSALPKQGETVELQGTYNGEATTFVYGGENYLSFEVEGVTYYLIDTLGGKPALILSASLTSGEDENETLAVKQDDFFGVWTAKNGATLTFNGCGASVYAQGNVEEQKADGSIKGYVYKVKDNEVILYRGSVEYAKFVSCEEENAGAYENGGKFYALVLTVV